MTVNGPIDAMSIEHLPKPDEACLAESLLAAARLNLPVVDRVLGAHGDATLSSYLTGLVAGHDPPAEAMVDLLDWLHAALDPLLGQSGARAAVHDLGASPTVLTASHHGVDSISQSFQGNLLFALNRWRRAGPQKTIWIFSCGNVPLNNSEYPRGLLYYHPRPESDGLTRKFPIFPDRLKRCMVSVAPALDAGMVARAERQLHRLIDAGSISPEAASQLRQVLREDYANPSVLALANYSEQSVLLNRRIWRRLFHRSAGSHNVVYFELEKAAAAMLMRDLDEADSLARCVLFDRGLRENVLHRLDGQRGCWHLAKLARSLEPAHGGGSSRHGCGSVFFWGVDEHRRRVPLLLTTDCSGGEALLGRDDQGRAFQLRFTSKALGDALQQGLLLPSLFTCFMTLSFARGLVCVGGYFQAQYLPIMQQGLMRALAETAGYGSLLPVVGRTPTDKYLSGMQAVMTRAGAGLLAPAGPLEIIAGGGLSGEEVEKILRLTVREAHLAGLFETAPDAAPPGLRPPGWEKQLARECHLLLGEKVVVK